MPIALPKLYDASMNLIGPLHPTKAGYHLKSLPLSTGKIVLQGEDETIEQGQFVELFDTWGAVGKFRVAKVKTTYGFPIKREATLEHAIVTLGDKQIIGYYEFGGTGVNTTASIDALLAMQQVTHWQRGTIAFDDEYQYSVENEYLINALLAVAKPIVDPWLWDFDTDNHPFTLNLIERPTTPAAELRLSRNIDELEVEVDRKDMRTRLYPLGYGEGVNQLTIADVNGGVLYISFIIESRLLTKSFFNN